MTRSITTAFALMLLFSTTATAATGTAQTKSKIPHQTKIAQNCPIKPIRPIPTMKPLWCTGTWTMILECTPNCDCVWREVCLN